MSLPSDFLERARLTIKSLDRWELEAQYMKALHEIERLQQFIDSIQEKVNELKSNL